MDLIKTVGIGLWSLVGVGVIGMGALAYFKPEALPWANKTQSRQESSQRATAGNVPAPRKESRVTGAPAPAGAFSTNPRAASQTLREAEIAFGAVALQPYSGSCRPVFSIKNRSEIGIASVTFDIMALDASGKPIGSTSVISKNLSQDQSDTDQRYLENVSCERIAEFQVKVGSIRAMDDPLNVKSLLRVAEESTVKVNGIAPKGRLSTSGRGGENGNSQRIINIIESQIAAFYQSGGRLPDGLAVTFGLLGNSLADPGWEFQSLSSAAVAMGTANMSGRSLPAGIAEINVNYMNRILGKKRKNCFHIRVVDDDEFGMLRQFTGDKCQEAAAGDEAWKQNVEYRATR
jgi:hypothetical protein